MVYSRERCAEETKQGSEHHLGVACVFHVSERDIIEVEVCDAGRRVVAMVFQAIEILVPFAACFATVRLLLLHAKSTWVR